MLKKKKKKKNLNKIAELFFIFYLLKFVDAKAFSVNITLMAASVNCHMLAVG
jgi:hypothetical protein